MDSLIFSVSDFNRSLPSPFFILFSLVDGSFSSSGIDVVPPVFFCSLDREAFSRRVTSEPFLFSLRPFSLSLNLRELFFLHAAWGLLREALPFTQRRADSIDGNGRYSSFFVLYRLVNPCSFSSLRAFFSRRRLPPRLC